MTRVAHVGIGVLAALLLAVFLAGMGAGWLFARPPGDALSAAPVVDAASAGPAAPVPAAGFAAPASPPAAAAASEEETLPDVVERVSRSVVSIESKQTVRGRIDHPLFNDPFWRRFFDIPRERERENRGSGVIVSAEGYVLTNNHLVGGAREIRVKLEDGRELDAEIVGADPRSDVAVLKIEGEDLPVVPLGSSSELRLGQTVIAIGYPFGIGQTVTKGIVSAQGRALRLVEYEDFIQTDAAINPGNSGGALINARGELVGINTAIASRTGGSHGIGFAIPIDFARSIMNSIIATGSVVRGYIGVNLQNVTPEMVEYFSLPGPGGALISQVLEDSPAARAGIERGDVIVEFDGKKVESLEHLRMLAAQSQPGKKVKVSVVRDGKRKSLTVEMGRRPDDEEQVEPVEAEEISPLFLGVGLQTLSDRYRDELDIPADVGGVIVTEVQSGTPASRAGLRRGDVIVEVNRAKIENMEDFRRVMDGYERNRIMIVILRGGGYFYLPIRS